VKQALSGLGRRARALHGRRADHLRRPARVLRFCKHELGLRTFLGHTNGSALPLANLDGANVSFKAFDPDKHLHYTGKPAEPIYANFRRAFEAGLELRASCVFIPGFVDLDEVERIVRFIADLSPDIPSTSWATSHPRTPWPRPTGEQMAEGVGLARGILSDVGFSHLSV